MRKIVAALLMWPLLACAAVTFEWNQESTTIHGDPIPAGEIAFQLEYSVDGGPLQYIDVPAGSLVSGSVSHVEPDLVVLCGQQLIARVRAIWDAQESDWSAQAQLRQTSCPPAAPSDMVIRF